MRVKMGFSSIKCKSTACGKVAISSTWRCRCRRLCVKCPAHVHQNLQIKRRKGIKKQMAEQKKARLGVDGLMPKRKGSKAEAKHSFEIMRQTGNERALYKKGSLLDLRFPHILKRQEVGWKPSDF